MSSKDNKEDNKNNKNSKVLGIRRENKNKWERRVALTPEGVKKLVKNGIKVIFQPCNLRCYTNKQYEDAGAEICEDISKADVILGVKEIPLDLFIDNKTFLFFSHTFKGQSNNMPALDKMLDQKVRLIDYELIKDQDKGARLVAFGKYAGLVGAIDFLQGLGQFLVHKKLYTPFLHVGFSYMYPSLEHAKKAVVKVGQMFKTKKLNQNLLPLIFAVTGNGRVTGGSVEILELLPHKWIEPDDLHKLFDGEDKSKNDIVYLTKLEHKHMYVRKDKNKEDQNCNNFDKQHFYKNKKMYNSIFAEKYLQYISAIFHCMYWDTDSPVLITDNDASDLSSKNNLRLLGITDITCDWPEASIKLLKKLTKIEKPFYSIDPITGIIEENFNKISNNAILYHSVDHLPSELPFDSSNHFSDKLTPFIPDLLKSNYPCEYKEDDLPPELHKATETWNGKLTPDYEYLYEELSKTFNSKYSKNKKE